MPATMLTLERLIRAPREDVFAAWTDPEALKHWWGPGPVTCPEAEIDLREGGAYRIANLGPDGSIIWISGHFERVRPPEELVYTWSVNAAPGDPTLDRPTLVRLELLDHPEGTTLRLTHERIPTEAVRDLHLQGWAGCIDKLEVYLAGGGMAAAGS